MNIHICIFELFFFNLILCFWNKTTLILSEQYSRPDTSTIEINNIKYIVYFTKKTWEDAVEQCRLIDASLIKVTNDNIHDVTYIMGENVTGKIMFGIIFVLHCFDIFKR